MLVAKKSLHYSWFDLFHSLKIWTPPTLLWYLKMIYFRSCCIKYFFFSLMKASQKLISSRGILFPSPKSYWIWIHLKIRKCFLTSSIVLLISYSEPHWRRQNWCSLSIGSSCMGKYILIFRVTDRNETRFFETMNKTLLNLYFESSIFSKQFWN